MKYENHDSLTRRHLLKTAAAASVVIPAYAAIGDATSATGVTRRMSLRRRFRAPAPRW